MQTNTTLFLISCWINSVLTFACHVFQQILVQDTQRCMYYWTIRTSKYLSLLFLCLLCVAYLATVRACVSFSCFLAWFSWWWGKGRKLRSHWAWLKDMHLHYEANFPDFHHSTASFVYSYSSHTTAQTSLSHSRTTDAVGTNFFWNYLVLSQPCQWNPFPFRDGD